MQVFQSWADIIIMVVLAITYIITFIAQRNQIRVLNDTIKSHSELTDSQSKHIDAFKKMFNPSDIEALIKLKIDNAILSTKKEGTNSIITTEGLTRHYQELALFILVITRYDMKFSTIAERDDFLRKIGTYTPSLLIPILHLYDDRIVALEKGLLSEKRP